LACQSLLSPRDNLDGTWVQRGVDTYAELVLVQPGTAVNGTFSYCGALQGCTTHYEVSGAAVFPLVVLRWWESGELVTFDGTVTADTLAGRMALNGQPPGPTTSFHRTPHGRAVDATRTSFSSWVSLCPPDPTRAV
jgi:hypothetical protein